MTGLAGLVRPEDKFWEVQNELITVLGVVGIKKHPRERLEPFKLLTDLRKLKQVDVPAKVRAYRLITFLVQLKRLGKEPSHKNNRYV